MELFTEDAVFLFHSRSADAPPGQGVGESLRLPASTFAELAAVPHWSKVLSNFAPANFSLDSLTWRSVEHFFQASKYVRVAPDYYRSFSLDSGSALAQGDGADAKRAGGRKGRPLDPATLAWWDAAK